MKIPIPTLVIHGEADPVFHPAHAIWTSLALLFARLHLIPDMGHAFDPAFFKPVINLLSDFLLRTYNKPLS